MFHLKHVQTGFFKDLFCGIPLPIFRKPSPAMGFSPWRSHEANSRRDRGSAAFQTARDLGALLGPGCDAPGMKRWQRWNLSHRGKLIHAERWYFSVLNYPAIGHPHLWKFPYHLHVWGGTGWRCPFRRLRRHKLMHSRACRCLGWSCDPAQGHCFPWIFRPCASQLPHL